MTTPKTYMSTSTRAGVRHWRTIRGGTPLCADATEPGAAVQSYLFCFRYDDTKPTTAPLWDGDRGEWAIFDLLTQEAAPC